jgi:hypothetical protein
MIGFTYARRFTWTVLVATCVVASSAGSAHAQGGRGGGGGGEAFRRMGAAGGFGQDMFTPGVDSRELERYQTILSLSREQQDTVRALFEGYNEEFRASATAVREKMTAARERMEAAREDGRQPGDRSGFQEMRGMFQEFRKQRDDMERAFLSDVQSVLTPEQQAQWPVVERVRRRERTVQRGLMSGERVDLIRLVDSQGLPPEVRGELSPVLSEYETELDRALIERNKAYDEGLTRMGDLFGAGDPETARAEAQRVMDAARQASTRVRDVNRKYARQVEQVLPEAARGRFEREFRQASSPAVYRETRTSRELTAAKGFGDLDEGQRQSLAALGESYQRDAGALNDQIARATEEAEESITVDRFFRARRDEIDDGPLGEFWRKRRDLDRITRESLRKLLSPEQIERLPRSERDEDDNTGDGAPGRNRRMGADRDRGEGETRPQGRGGGRR